MDPLESTNGEAGFSCYLLRFVEVDPVNAAADRPVTFGLSDAAFDVADYEVRAREGASVTPPSMVSALGGRETWRCKQRRMRGGGFEPTNPYGTRP